MEHFVLANLFTKGIIFLISCLRPWATNPTQKDPLLQQNNLLLEEQILSFKSWSPLKRGVQNETGWFESIYTPFTLKRWR